MKCIRSNTKKETKAKTSPKRPTDTIKLHKLEIVRFGGNSKTWQLFSDSFVVTIDNSVSLTNVKKLATLDRFLLNFYIVLPYCPCERQLRRRTKITTISRWK